MTMLHLPCEKARAQAKHQWESLADAHADMCNCSIQQGSSDCSKEDMPRVPGGVLGLSWEHVYLMADLHLEQWGKCPGCCSASPAVMLSFLCLWTCKLLSPPANVNVSLYCMEMLVLLCATVRIHFFFLNIDKTTLFSMSSFYETRDIFQVMFSPQNLDWGRCSLGKFKPQ